MKSKLLHLPSGDYIDRFNGHFFSLWSANQDGGNPQLVYDKVSHSMRIIPRASSPGSMASLDMVPCMIEPKRPDMWNEYLMIDGLMNQHTLKLNPKNSRTTHYEKIFH